MQVIKKFSLILLCVALWSCRSSTGPEIITRGGFEEVNTDLEEITISGGSAFRVGVLLPLTGKAAKQGQGLKNATMAAMEDINNPNLLLQYYDTQSTPGGARIAAQNAISQRARLIIGPLMSSEVQAIANETIYRGVPVIAFTSSQDVLQPTVYTLGLLIEEQVNRIITYAAQKGRRRFALLLPDNATGSAVAKAAVKAAQKNGVEVTVVGFYPPQTSDFSGIIKQMSDYSTRHARLENLRATLQKRADNGDTVSDKALQRLKTKEGLGDIGFDAVLIPESGARLTSAISMFAYYDAAYPQVQFLGTSLWENSRLNKESAIVRSVYPALSRTHSGYFANKYAAVFGERPSSLYSFGYDAVALANQLARAETDNLNQVITNPDGYAGINGAFRLFEDGSNQHSLDIMEIRPAGDVVVDAAPKTFSFRSDNPQLEPVRIDSYYRAPLIYGKDNTTAQLMIYGQVLPIENQAQRFRDPEAERAAVAEELRAMNIVIP